MSAGAIVPEGDASRGAALPADLSERLLSIAEFARREARLAAVEAEALLDRYGERPELIGPCMTVFQLARIHGRAATLARRVLADAPGDARATRVLAEALAESGEHEAALPVLAAAVRHEPDAPGLRFSLVRSLAALGRDARAAQVAAEAIADTSAQVSRERAAGFSVHVTAHVKSLGPVVSAGMFCAGRAGDAAALVDLCEEYVALANRGDTWAVRHAEDAITEATAALRAAWLHGAEAILRERTHPNDPVRDAWVARQAEAEGKEARRAMTDPSVPPWIRALLPADDLRAPSEDVWRDRCSVAVDAIRADPAGTTQAWDRFAVAHPVAWRRLRFVRAELLEAARDVPVGPDAPPHPFEAGLRVPRPIDVALGERIFDASDLPEFAPRRDLRKPPSLLRRRLRFLWKLCGRFYLLAFLVMALWYVFTVERR